MLDSYNAQDSPSQRIIVLCLIWLWNFPPVHWETECLMTFQVGGVLFLTFSFILSCVITQEIVLILYFLMRPSSFVRIFFLFIFSTLIIFNLSWHIILTSVNIIFLKKKKKSIFLFLIICKQVQFLSLILTLFNSGAHLCCLFFKF